MTRFVLGVRLIITLTLLALVLGACPAGAESGGRFKDPFEYCEAVWNIDQPDGRYIGPKIPIPIARGLQTAFGAPPSGSLQPFLRGTFWRCMNGKVYACNVGANTPCTAKADLSRTLTQAMSGEMDPPVGRMRTKRRPPDMRGAPFLCLEDLRAGDQDCLYPPEGERI